MSRKKSVPQKPVLTPAVPDYPTVFNWKMALALFGLALLIRLITLGRADLWGDEILFVNRTYPPTSPYKVLYVGWIDLMLITHLPFAELAQNLLMWPFYWMGFDMINNTWIQRLPAALWGSGSVVAFYALCSKIFRKPTALIGALTMCCFFYPVYYSREVYYYAPLIFLATASLNLYAGFVIRQQASKRQMAGFIACMSALVTCHLTGMLLGGLLLLLHLGYLGYVTILRRATPLSGFLRKSTLHFVVPLLTAAPFFIKLVTQPLEAGMHGATMNLAQLLLAILGKFTLGTAFVWPLAGSAIILAGAAYLLHKGPQREARILLVLFALGGLLIFGVIQMRTQFAVRYFNALLPGVLCLWAGGIEALIRMSSRLLKVGPNQEDRAVYALGLLFVLAHMLVFLPPMYQLRAKARDFGGVARWLTAHMRTGTPYFFECGGWDECFVPIYYPTPGLAHTVKLKWNGPDFMAAKRAQQTNIMTRFPESACVEYVELEWPELQNAYRRKQELRNEPLLSLVRRGIWFEPTPTNAPERAPGDLNIWYNTEEDAIQIAREAGAPAYFAYDNTECAQKAEGVYVHAAQGKKATVRVINLTDKPQQGRFRMEGALNTSQEACPLFVSWQNQVIVQTSCVRRSDWILETPLVTLPVGEHPLTLLANEREGEPVLNVALMQMTFLPEP